MVMSMTRDCPECGDPLIRTADGGFGCIQCGWSGDADDAPEPTGSPLDVDADLNGRVRLDCPDPRRHMDNNSARMSPDGARRLAEALEVAADDAERRDNREGEPITDGGEDTDEPSEVYQKLTEMELSDDWTLSTLRNVAEDDLCSAISGVIPEADVKLAQISLTFVDENGIQRTWKRSADGYDPEDFEQPVTDGGEDTEPIPCAICGNPIEGESELSADGEVHPECNTNFSGDDLMTDGGVDGPEPFTLGDVTVPADVVAGLDPDKAESRREMFTCPDCGEVADARLEAPEFGGKLWKRWMDIHDVTEDGDAVVYVHVDVDGVDRSRDLARFMAAMEKREDPDPEPEDDRPQSDAYDRQRARERQRRPRTDGGLNREHVPITEWELKARSNIQKWGLQSVDALLLAMGEEMGELAMEVQSPSDYTTDGRDAELGRDLIRRMATLGRDIREFLETVSEDADGNPVPDDDRPGYLDPFPVEANREQRERHIRSELDDLMALGYQFLWALDGGAR